MNRASALVLADTSILDGWAGWKDKMKFLKKIFRQNENAPALHSPFEDPIAAFTLNYNAGNNALNSGNNRAAVDCYNDAIKIWENAAQHKRDAIPEVMAAMCLTNRGTALTRLGYVNEAITSFDRSISICPSFVMAYYGKAWVLEWDERVGPAGAYILLLVFTMFVILLDKM